MLHEASPIFLIDQSGDTKPPRMLAYRFRIRSGYIDDIFQGCPFIGGNHKQDLNAVVIGHAFQMPLHLLRGFQLIHTLKYTTSLETPVFKDVVSRPLQKKMKYGVLIVKGGSLT